MVLLPHFSMHYRKSVYFNEVILRVNASGDSLMSLEFRYCQKKLSTLIHINPHFFHIINKLQYFYI